MEKTLENTKQLCNYVTAESNLHKLYVTQWSLLYSYAGTLTAVWYLHVELPSSM